MSCTNKDQVSFNPTVGEGVGGGTVGEGVGGGSLKVV
jgi:hypothetical protein